jgi:hypothetical protein
MVSVNGSPWEPRQVHGQYMTLDGKPLERITALEWLTCEVMPLRLRLLE